MKFPNKIINSICKKYRITLINFKSKKQIEKHLKDRDIDLEPKTFYNNSYLARVNRTIILGKYNKQVNKVASFFHELGHLHDLNYNKSVLRSYFVYEQEKAAWKIGMSIAEYNNIKFDKDVYSFIRNSLKTYKHKRKNTWL